MADYSSTFSDIRSDFESRDIPTDSPGFYDHPTFSARERMNPEYLNNYARFVQQQDYDAGYLGRSGQIIDIVVNAFRKDLPEKTCREISLDAAMAISKILEQEGIWNFVVKGALIIHPPSGSNLEPLHLWPYDPMTGADLAHAWVYAPAFPVIDVTLKRHPQCERFAENLPEVVLGDNAPEKSTSPPAQKPRAPQGSKNYGLLPHLKKFFRTFPGTRIDLGTLALEYIPTSVTASEVPLQSLPALHADGKTALQLYKDLIQPKILSNAA